MAFTERFVTAIVKNDGTSRLALKGGNAQTGTIFLETTNRNAVFICILGTLTTLYNGGLPAGYSPMKVEGGIILGTGGDDSSSSEGTFYEGAYFYFFYMPPLDLYQ